MALVSQIGDATLEGVCIQWKIRDFFSLSDKVGDFYASPSFSLGDTKWQLKLFPNGVMPYSSSEWVGLSLARKDSVPSDTFYCALSIKGSDGVMEEIFHGMVVCGKNSTWHLPKCWSRTEMENRKSTLLPDDTLNIICDLRCSNPPNSVESGEKMLKSLQSMLECGEDTDVVIKIKGKEFPAHRGILRARSSVFRSMLSDDMETQSNVVTVEDGDPESFPDFLVHIYTGSCAQISTKNVYSLYTAANKFDLGELKVKCSLFMKRSINIVDFCDVITLAVQHDDKDLIECATNFFCNSFVDIVKTAKWQTFLEENSRLGNELLMKAMSQSSTNANQIKNSAPKCSKGLEIILSSALLLYFFVGLKLLKF